MDYREELFRPLSIRFVDGLVSEVFQHPTDFQIVFQLIFDSDLKVAWRAAWACQKISEKYPEWFSHSYFEELVNLTISTNHGGLKRGCLSILNNISSPDSIPVEIINSCFEWMISPRSPIAVQALSMKMLYRICQSQPNFIPEFRLYLNAILPEDYSKGFNATQRNILKK